MPPLLKKISFESGAKKTRTDNFRSGDVPFNPEIMRATFCP